MQVRTLAPPGVKDLLELSLNWDFPIFRLEELTGRRSAPEILWILGSTALEKASSSLVRPIWSLPGME